MIHPNVTGQILSFERKVYFQAQPTPCRLSFSVSTLSPGAPFFKGHVYMFWTRALGHNFHCNSRLYFQMGIFKQATGVQYALGKL